MKRLLITLLLALLAVATVVLWREWPCLFPSSEVNELYSRYEHNDHIRATSIKDFHVNDTLRVDVTTLQADNDSAWCALLLDFGAPAELIELYKTNKEFFVGENVNTLTMFYIDKNNLGKQLPNTNPDSRLVILSHVKRSLCIFMTEKQNSKEQIVLSKTKNLKR